MYLRISKNEPLNDLPTDLKILEITCYYNHPLDFLPIALEELYVFFYEGTLKNLPPNLKVFGFYEENNSEVEVPLGCEIRRYFRKKGEWIYWLEK